MAASKESVAKVLNFVKENNIKIIDFKFMDFPGQWQHFTVPYTELNEGSFEDGYGFDGSSLRGWKNINESDMLIIPDPESMVVDPFIEAPTLSMICDVYEPATKEKYTRCPRNIAQKAEAYLKSTGIADTVYFGPEAEFFVFDDVRFDSTPNSSFYYVDSVEGRWNTGRDEEPNLAYKPRYKEGYFPVPPTDSLMDLRNEMILKLIDMGIHVEAQHHEVASGGQCEIDLRFQPLVTAADQLLMFKYVVKNTARLNGKTVTYMPKPIMGDNGSGMHVHTSLWKDGKPLFAGNGYAGLSEMALYYIGGLIKHAPSLLAFTNPTTNSYKRLVPGFEAPVRLAYSQRNRSAAIRIPMYSSSPKAKRVEFRCPDPSANPYLGFAAIMMAGLDGINNRIDPGDPLDKDIYDMEPEELMNVPSTPESLSAALKALADDHEYLLKGDVFTEDVIDTWIKYKFEKEIKPMALQPHPFEFGLYYDV
ncbi:MAG: type I glutamate--ammonia ligase [Melioribacteraceae bacterium]|nr:type I glutamate--ammonia ligase [Melioribacteraceae bacterium]MCF8356121.1 type I glutamate--ammonia ligase [Melioribacteraceae bacterium]MCF8395903.1 type I glutamate--ammonia ligase [Melioribacteraceae bacterium]MCF8420991.1 type I glutamate--ammonia ligase [Melioribacteraceae bacterium]